MQTTTKTQSHIYPAYFVSAASEHSMGDNLLPYVEMKIHHFVTEKEYNRVIVVGKHDRANTTIYTREKTGKLANWQRPTASLEGDTLYIYCFPGTEYVRHYAALIATYFQLSGKKDPNCVWYELPSEKQCWDAIEAEELGTVPVSDWLILGSGLSEIAQSDSLWQGTDDYLWTQTTINSKTVTFLVFQHSFWGDILERLVHHLAELGHARQIFIAKVGGLRMEHIPNRTLATGSCSFVEGELITWENIFANAEHPKLFKGDHLNSPSVLFEVNNWLKFVDNFDFVDSEIGHFAKGCVRARLAEFGYLHFISNRLIKPYTEDLSNERLPSIIEKRDQLKRDIRDILEQTLV